jgi:hypothetical protein
MTTIEIPGSGEHEVISLDPLTLETIKNELLFGELGLATKEYMDRNGFEKLFWPPQFASADMCIMYAPEGDGYVPVLTNGTATGIASRFERDWFLFPPKGVETTESDAQAVGEMPASVESLPAGVEEEEDEPGPDLREIARESFKCEKILTDGSTCPDSFGLPSSLRGHYSSKSANHAVIGFEKGLT